MKEEIKEACKLWDLCINKECLKAIKQGLPWSIEICYDLHELMKNGLVASTKPVWRDVKCAQKKKLKES